MEEQARIIDLKGNGNSLTEKEIISFGNNNELMQGAFFLANSLICYNFVKRNEEEKKITLTIGTVAFFSARKCASFYYLSFKRN